MLVCTEPSLAVWTPDLSGSGREDAAWTRLRCGELGLSNSLEWVAWHAPGRVQVEICEECGVTHCAPGGYVHLSRLGEDVLWTPPLLDADDEREQLGPSAAVAQHGGVLLPAAVWRGLRERFPRLPDPAGLPATRRADLAAAWATGAAPPEALSAADPHATGLALARLAAVAAWLTADGEAEVEATLRRAADVGAEVAALRVEPEGREWRPVARAGDRLSPAFAGEWVLEPAPVADVA